MTVDCENCPLRKKDAFVPFSKSELAFMGGFKSGELSVDPRTTVLMEGTSSPHFYTVLSGMGIRYKTLENGRRQVINFIFPGDFVGLQSVVMGESEYSVEATQSMVICAFRRQDLWRLFQVHPERAYDLVWISAVEEAFLGQSLATLGQRSGRERVSWALLKIFERLTMIGLQKLGKVPFPYKQQDLADALGLSLVHTNKTLAALRKDGLVEWADGTLEVQDADGMREAAVLSVEEPKRRPLI